MNSLDDKLILNEHERPFEIHPIGIKYICEFCNEGEMIVDSSAKRENNLFPHICTKCHKTMLLPKMYPYVEWKSFNVN